MFQKEFYSIKGTKGRVLVGPGMSEEWRVSVGLRQGNALSPLMFIMVMELVSRKVSWRGSMGRRVCGRSGCCGGEWAGDAGSTGGVLGRIWEAWAEYEYREDCGDVDQAAEKRNECQIRREGDQAGK